MPSCAPPPGFHMPSCARHLGFTCPPAPRHLGFTCPPAPTTWVSHALLRPPPGFHMPSCAPPPGLHMPSCAPPPGFHMPSCAPPPGFHLGFTCPPAPRHLGFTWFLCARHLGFTCPPAPATWVSHALLRPATWVSLLSANLCGRRPGNKSSAGFSRRFPEGGKRGVKPRCRPLGGFTKLGELVLPPGQTTAFGVTLNPGQKWLDLQPGDPSALLPQLCKAGTTSAAASPPAPKPECHCGSKRHWHPEATGQPTQQNARSGKTAAAWVSPQPGSPLRPLDAAPGSGPGFELGFAEVADRDHSPLMPNLQRMEGGIP